MYDYVDVGNIYTVCNMYMCVVDLRNNNCRKCDTNSVINVRNMNNNNNHMALCLPNYFETARNNLFFPIHYSILLNNFCDYSQ